MATARRQGGVDEELRQLRASVDALTLQLGLCLETLSLMRADQLRLLGGGGPSVHRCSDGPEPARRRRPRKA